MQELFYHKSTKINSNKMKKIIALLIIGFFAVNMNQANAQVVKRFMDKRKDTAAETATDRVGEEADKEVVKGVNKQLDKLFGKSDEKSTETPASVTDSSSSNSSSSSSSSASGIGMSALLSGMGMSTTANVKDSYDFDAYIEMTITSYDKKGKEEESGIYISYIDADSPDYGMSISEEDEEDAVLMIFDTENNLMLTLSDSDGEKTGFAVAFNEEQMEAISESYEEEETEVEANPYDVKKTGRTKKILGYKCDEYQTEDESSIVSIWSTDELGKKIDKTFMRSSNFSGMFFYAYYTDGFVLEYVIENKDDNEKTVMTITDIDTDKKTSVKTAGYTIMSIGAMEMDDSE